MNNLEIALWLNPMPNKAGVFPANVPPAKILFSTPLIEKGIPGCKHFQSSVVISGVWVSGKFYVGVSCAFSTFGWGYYAKPDRDSGFFNEEEAEFFTLLKILASLQLQQSNNDKQTRKLLEKRVAEISPSLRNSELPF